MKEDIMMIEYFVEKLRKIQEDYDNMQASYGDLVNRYDKLSSKFWKLQDDYDCCSLDLLVTRQEFDNANRAGYRNKHESQQDSPCKDN